MVMAPIELGTYLSDMQNAIARGFTIIAVVDNCDSDKYRYMNCVIMGVLLPPYESLSAEIDGDTQKAASIYYSFLSSKLDIFANIIAAAYRGKPLMIFIPEDESMNFGFVGVLGSFFMDVFGIVLGMDATPGAISDQPEFVAARVDVMFTYGLLNLDEYCALMPPGIMPTPNACGKMMQLLNYNFPSMEHCIDYCTQYIIASKQRINGMFSPVFRVNKP